jgi:hypothetical protein
VDFGHISAVADTRYAAGFVLADRRCWATHSSSEAAVAAVLVAAAVAAGLVSLVHRSRV